MQAIFRGIENYLLNALSHKIHVVLQSFVFFF